MNNPYRRETNPHCYTPTASVVEPNLTAQYAWTAQQVMLVSEYLITRRAYHAARSYSRRTLLSNKALELLDQIGQARCVWLIDILAQNDSTPVLK